MYPDLSYIFHDLFGSAPDNWLSIFKTFGLFLVLAILGSAWVLYTELKRKAQEGKFRPSAIKVTEGAPATATQIAGSAFWGFLVGWKVVYALMNRQELVEDAPGLILSLKGNLVFGIIGAALFGFWRYWDANRKKLPAPQTKEIPLMPHQRVGDITIMAAVAGVVGAKIFDAIEHMEDLLRDPIGTLLSGGGLAIYGGLIFGFIAVFLYLRRHKIPPLHVMDAAAPALIIGYGIGRIGCQLSGDGDWGIVNTAAQPSWWFLPDWVWAFNYPRNVINEGVSIPDCVWIYCNQLGEPVYPTPFYETLMAFAIAGVLWSLRKKITAPGVLFFIYVFLNGLERFWIEKIRINIRYDFLGLNPTQAEIIAVVLMLVGVLGAWFFLREYKTKQFVGKG